MKKITKEQAKEWFKKNKNKILLGLGGVATAALTAGVIHTYAKETKALELQEPDLALDDGEIWTAKFYNKEGEEQGETQIYESFAQDLINE